LCEEKSGNPAFDDVRLHSLSVTAKTKVKSAKTIFFLANALTKLFRANFPPNKRRRQVKMSEIKLSEIKLSKIKMSKIKMPEIKMSRNQNVRNQNV
jgi:hypothetical protein